VGARPLDVATLPIDAVCCCGFKWLCGPYATGFAWIASELLEQLNYPQPYWLTMQGELDLTTELGYTVVERDDGRAHDVYGTANFLNFVPWTAALMHFEAFGLEAIAAHDQALVERFLDGLDELPYELVSPRRGPERSTLVLFSHRQPERNQQVFGALQNARIDIALRNGKLRVSPHLYNSGEDIDAALAVLARAEA
jgi:selenocysteine lyase/cysteine desulfurase